MVNKLRKKSVIFGVIIGIIFFICILVTITVNFITASSYDEITVFADSYAKCVEIDSPNSDFVLSDNYFDINAGCKTVKILSGTPKTINLRSVYNIK